MIRNMLRLRGSFNDLARINREVEEENKVLQKKSVTDALTQMDNRAGLNAYAGQSFNRAIQSGQDWAIEILDIDYFKEYNDNYGHQAGDECIAFVASMVKALKRYPGVFCARYGGDEFVVIYEGYKDTEVFEMAKDLKATILKKAVEHKFTKSYMKIVTVSQGIFWGDQIAKLHYDGPQTRRRRRSPVGRMKTARRRDENNIKREERAVRRKPGGLFFKAGRLVGVLLS